MTKMKSFSPDGISRQVVRDVRENSCMLKIAMGTPLPPGRGPVSRHALPVLDDIKTLAGPPNHDPSPRRTNDVTLLVSSSRIS
jgi:hypothetical protein